MREIDRRRVQSESLLVDISAKLSESASLCSDKACVYVTGSLGRLEISDNSDLDLFIASSMGDENIPSLSKLDEICVKSDLIKATRSLKLPEFSGDGQYLASYSIHDLTSSVGSPYDDSKNTMTARLLLLLESKPLIGPYAYKKIIESVINKYWIDFPGHEIDFVPAFLSNDILRLWRTLCVNYEAGRQNQSEAAKIKARIKNYKLKHSRMLTCYSAIIFMLAVYMNNKCVTPMDMFDMVEKTPVERIEWVASCVQSSEDVAKNVVDAYEKFLIMMARDVSVLTEEFSSREKAHARLVDAGRFGEKIFKLLMTLGDKNGSNDLFRVIVV